MKTSVETKGYKNVAKNELTSGVGSKTSGILISNVKSIKSTEIKNLSEKKSSKEEKLDHICRDCNQKFISDLDLVLHFNSNHRDVESYVCHECREIFYTRDVFSNHLAEHQNSKTITETKPSKQKSITEFLRSYRKPNTSGEMPLITEMLKPSCSSNGETNSILVKTETTSDNIQCNECKKIFESIDILESHIRTSHPCLLCGKCNQLFYRKNDVFKHLSAVHKIPNNIYCCPVCNFTTTNSQGFKSHQKSNNCKRGHLKCPFSGCEARFSRNDNLKRHKKICKRKYQKKIDSTQQLLQPVVKTNDEYLCSLCSYKTKFKSFFERHLSSHNNERPFKCDINGCVKAYKQSKHLKWHQKTIHQKELHFNLLNELNKNIRNISKLEFSSNDNQLNEFSKQQIKLEVISNSDDESFLKDSTEAHNINGDQQINNEKVIVKVEKIEKTKKGKFGCKLCSFSTRFKRNLIFHESAKHPELRPYKCQILGCGKSYTRADTLAKHKRTSHNVNDIEDTVMIKSSTHSVNVSKSGQIFECDVCRYKTKHIFLLRRHMAIHHSLSKPYKCNVEGCHYVSSLEDYLKRHQKRVHKMNGQKFVCNYPKCLRRFDSQQLLKQHINSHKNKFVCRFEGCQYRTDTFAKLNQHRRSENHMPPQLL